MKIFKTYTATLCCLFCAFLVLACSTSGDSVSDDLNQAGGTPGGQIDKDEKNALAAVVTDWNANLETVMESMKKYDLEEQDESYLKYSKDNGALFTYSFKNGKLMAAALLMPTDSDEPVNVTELGKYSYVGDIDFNRIYTNMESNNMLSTSNRTTLSRDYRVFGFAPITSDLYEYKSLPGVTTGIANAITIRSATLHGAISNVEQSCKGGIRWADNVEMQNSTMKTVSAVKDSFSVKIDGLSMGSSYYYQAFIVVDGIYYYGDVMQFETVTMPIYNIGDFYPDEQNPEGVVFYVTDGGVSGKILSLDQSSMQWDTRGNFCTNYGCTSSTDGEANTKKMGSSLPIKEYIVSNGNGWYCPALRELQTLASNYEAVESALDSKGYATLGNLYWSSTEKNVNQVYVVIVGNFDRYSSGYTVYHNKDSRHVVRAVKKF